MFYSHEVLTSRKHGVATVWLVATLGSKSTLKKVDRKELCAVDIPKACKTIVSPEAPMALRLQSNLLFGVSRVYGEQCGYVLKDAQAEQNKIKALIRALHTAPTTLDGKHKAKPDQLMLPDDPNFVPELAWGMDFDPFHMDLDYTSAEGSSQRSSLLSPRRVASSALGSEHLDPTLQQPNIIIPGSASSFSAGGPGLGFGGGGGGGGGGSASNDRMSYNPSFYAQQGDGLLGDLGFSFDEEGNMVETGQPQPPEEPAPSVHTPVRPTMREDALPEDDDYRDRPMMPLDDDTLPVFQQDDYNMQDVEAFPVGNAQQTEDAHQTENFQQPDEAPPADAQGSPAAEGSSTTVSAPARRARVPRVLPADQELELHNADLANWNNTYLATMQQATQLRFQKQAKGIATKNADFWVLRNGVGGLGQIFGNDVPEPLAMFTGNALIEALTGLRLSVAGEKRPREEGAEPEAEAEAEAEEQDSARRVRARSDEGEIGRGDGDTAIFDMGGDTAFQDQDQTIEFGREAPTPLAEHLSSAQMPWNIHITGSGRVSSVQPVIHPFSVAGGGATSSIGGFIPPHRHVSASPLVGRSGQLQNYDNLQLLHSDDGDFQMGMGMDEIARGSSVAREQPSSMAPSYELFGPAAAVSTQVAGTSKWVKDALTSESMNFLEFVKDGITAANSPPEREEHVKGTVEFETLLPTQSNTAVVAAQGLLHVLTLVTSGLMKAGQPEAFSVITLSVI